MKAFTISTFLTLLITKGYCQDTLPYYFQCLPCAPEYNSYNKLEFLDDSTAAFVGNFLETECFSDLKGILLLKNGEIIAPPQPTILYYADDFIISDIVEYNGKYIAAGSMGIQDISTWTNFDSLNVEVVGTNYFIDRIKLAVDTSLNLLYWAGGEIESVNGSVVNKSFGYYDGTSAHLIDVPFSETYGFNSMIIPEPGIVWIQPDGGSLQLYEYNFYTDTVTLMENPLSVPPYYGAEFYDGFNDSAIYLFEIQYLTPENQLAKYKNGEWSDFIETWGVEEIFQGPDDYVFMTGCFDYYCEINFGTVNFPVLTPAVLKNTMLPVSSKGIFNSGEYYMYGNMEDVMDDCETFGKLVDTIIVTEIEEFSNDINIYPNPVVTVLVYELPSSLTQEILKICLVDQLGKTIKTFAPCEKYLQLPEISEGLYYLLFVTNDMKISKTIIKTN
ncbi:MAG: T9SS type A sorting domain-containing protein [Chitinophagaceae bacterium]